MLQMYNQFNNTQQVEGKEENEEDLDEDSNFSHLKDNFSIENDSSAEKRSIIKESLNSFEHGLKNHGYVYSLGDGIIVVYGLYEITAGEMVCFQRSNIIGMALNLTSDYVGVLPFYDEQYITEGDIVTRLYK
jgi:F0F1-type ATP synthase alpha subunit